MVSITTLLLLTSTRAALFKALGALKLPRAFVTVLYITYRHLLILLKRVEENAMARRGAYDLRSAEQGSKAMVRRKGGRNYYPLPRYGRGGGAGDGVARF